MKILKFILIIGIIFCSCNDDEFNQEPDPILEENIAIKKENVYSTEDIEESVTIISGNDDGSLMNIQIGSETNLEIGDVIVAGETEVYPDGIARKITSISGSGSQLEVTTEPAKLTDVYEELNVTGEFGLNMLANPIEVSQSELNARGFNGDAMEELDFNVEIGDWVSVSVIDANNFSINLTYDYDGDPQTSNDQIQLEADVNVQIDESSFFTVYIDEDIKPSIVTGGLIKINPTIRSISTGDLAPTDFSPSRKKYHLYKVPIPITGLPTDLLVRPSIAFYFTADLQLQAELDFELPINTALNFHVENTAQHREWNNYVTTAANIDSENIVFNSASLSGGAELGVSAGIEFGLSQYQGYIPNGADDPSDTQAKIGVYIDPTIDLDFEVGALNLQGQLIQYGNYGADFVVNGSINAKLELWDLVNSNWEEEIELIRRPIIEERKFGTEVYEGDLQFTTQEDIDIFSITNLKNITGYLIVGNYDINNPDFPENNEIFNFTAFNQLTSINGLIIYKVNSINQIESFNSLTDIEFISISGNENLISINGFENITNCMVIWITHNDSLNSINGFNNILEIGNETIGGGLSIENENLNEINAFQSLQSANSIGLFYSNGLQDIRFTNLQTVNKLNISGGPSSWTEPGEEFRNEIINGRNGSSRRLGENSFPALETATDFKLNNLLGIENLNCFGALRNVSNINISNCGDLSDYCALNLNWDEIINFDVNNNLFNPTLEDLQNADCSL